MSKNISIGEKKELNPKIKEFSKIMQHELNENSHNVKNF